MTTPDGGDIKRRLRLSVLIAVLGVVYGDLGTSPLYTLQTALGYFQDSGEQVSDVYGILSLIFWSLTVVVTLKYVTFIMRADNNGEGGILALMALASRVAHSAKARTVIGLFGIIGAGLFFGDGVITPAISMLSAIEGLEVISPDLTPFVIPAALAVIAGLFLVQRHGTAAVGRAFGPIMAIWFFSIGGLGLVQIVLHPLVLGALNPYDGVTFIIRHPRISFIALGAVVLAVTGAEALYADMSHFGRNPIRAAWIYFVFPSVVLNYFGQGALVLSTPSAANNPFFNMAPHVLQIPLVVLATLATVIASQAVISGAYSVARHLHAARHVPPHGGPPHQRARTRPDLRPANQRPARRRRHPAGTHLPLQQRPGRGLRHRGHRHAVHVTNVLAAASSTAASSNGRSAAWSPSSACSASWTSPSSPPTP